MRDNTDDFVGRWDKYWLFYFVHSIVKLHLQFIESIFIYGRLIQSIFTLNSNDNGCDINGNLSFAMRSNEYFNVSFFNNLWLIFFVLYTW